MSIEEDLERLGGVIPVGTPAAAPPSREDIETLVAQSGGLALPEDYLAFITRYGSCTIGSEVVVKLPQSRSQYVHDDRTGLRNPSRREISLAHFYGADQKTMTLSLRWAIKTYGPRIPDAFVPLADDGGGNQICWGSSLDGRPSFHWWDHDNEWDAEDYEDDTGEAMPEAAKYQNVYFICETFAELLSMLRKVG